MSDWVRVAAKGDVAEGACLGVRVGSKEVAIYHLPGGEFRAHRQRLLARVCAAVGWLGWRTAASSARCTPHSSTFAPARRCPRRQMKTIAVFPVKIEGEDVMVQVSG